MGTVVAIDLSVSMIRPIKTNASVTEPVTLLDLAVHGVHYLLDYLAKNMEFEYVSVVTFSSECKVLVPFTRDYECIKAKIAELDFETSTCYPEVIKKINDLVLTEWCNSVVCNVVMITDGGCYEQLRKPDIGSFSFFGKLMVVALEEVPSIFKNNYKTNKLPNNVGSIFCPKLPLSKNSVSESFEKLVGETYVRHNTVLQCGNLKSDVQLFPSPLSYTKESHFGTKIYKLSNELSIIGFLEMSEVKCPATLSRHLILPKTDLNEQSDIDDSSNTPSFCVLLHNALKKENMAAVCQLGVNWYGLLINWIIGKRKSYLVLAILEIGSNAIPWLGKLEDLALLPSVQSESSVPPLRVMSYNQPYFIWMKDNSIQTNIHKLMRTARKLPHKVLGFYKELNGIRRIAMAYSFDDVLMRVADLLDDELARLPRNSDPECSLQLTHAVSELRKPSAMEVSHIIMPIFKNINLNSL